LPPDSELRDNSLPDVISEAMALPDTILTSSRKDWLHFRLDQALNQFGGAALDFLVKDPYTYLNIDPAAYCGSDWQDGWVITTVPNAKLSSAIEALDAWLTIASTEPGRWAALIDEGDDAEGIAKDFENSEDLRDEGACHDGEWPYYLFSFLKSLRAALVFAQVNGLALVHVRYVYLFA